MPVNAADLPKAVREKLGVATPASSGRSRKGTGMGAACPGRCQCGLAFPNYLRWEDHRDTATEGSHVRWVIDLSPAGS